MKSLTEQFADWVRSKPAEEEYEYYDVDNCACGQFCKFLGITGKDERYRMEHRFGRFVVPEPHTFSALATRLEGIQS